MIVDTSPIYGMMAEFETPETLISACERAHKEGFRELDAYSPFPVEELHHVLHLPKSKISLIVLIGGIVGFIGGFSLLYWTSVIDYPINVGGRPLNSWPSFIPITFETTVLCAGLSAVVGMFFLNKLPMPYHPVFNVPRFAMASRDRFFLCIKARDPLFQLEKTKAFLESLDTKGVYEVPV